MGLNPNLPPFKGYKGIMRVKKALLCLGVLLLLGQYVGAFELDMSVDDEIRAKYNPSKLENDVLNDLPQILKNDANTGHASTTLSNPVPVAYPKIDVPTAEITTDFSKTKGGVVKTTGTSLGGDRFTEVRVKKGTKFKVRSLTKISDYNTAGARMTFSTTELVTKRYVTFPVGTTFKAEIENSHQPQMAGNGGLLKIKADTLVCQGHTHPIEAKVIRANGKKIYFNNIKGKRGYWKGVGKQVSKGENFYLKSKKVSSRLSNNPFGAVIAPIPTLVGSIGYTGNLLISPIAAIWAKGEHIAIPAGANYTLKLKQDLILQK